MHLGAALVADEQPLELMKVSEGALDDPTDCAQSGAVSGAASRDRRFDPSRTQHSPVLVVVVAAIGDQLVGAATRPARQAGDGRHPVEQRDQLRNVVAVAARQRVGERDPARVDQEMVLRACAAPVDRARVRFGAPFFACT